MVHSYASTQTKGQIVKASSPMETRSKGENFTESDVKVLLEIVHRAGKMAANNQVMLSHLLAAYKEVLAERSIEAKFETKLYGEILNLSVEPKANWRDKIRKLNPPASSGVTRHEKGSLEEEKHEGIQLSSRDERALVTQPEEGSTFIADQRRKSQLLSYHFSEWLQNAASRRQALHNDLDAELRKNRRLRLFKRWRDLKAALSKYAAVKCRACTACEASAWFACQRAYFGSHLVRRTRILYLRPFFGRLRKALSVHRKTQSARSRWCLMKLRSSYARWHSFLVNHRLQRITENILQRRGKRLLSKVFKPWFSEATLTQGQPQQSGDARTLFPTLSLASRGLLFICTSAWIKSVFPHGALLRGSLTACCDSREQLAFAMRCWCKRVTRKKHESDQNRPLHLMAEVRKENLFSSWNRHSRWKAYACELLQKFRVLRRQNARHAVLEKWCYQATRIKSLNDVLDADLNRFTKLKKSFIIDYWRTALKARSKLMRQNRRAKEAARGGLEMKSFYAWERRTQERKKRDALGSLLEKRYDFCKEKEVARRWLEKGSLKGELLRTGPSTGKRFGAPLQRPMKAVHFVDENRANQAPTSAFCGHIVISRWLAVVFYSQRVGRAKSELREKLVWRRRFLFFQCLKEAHNKYHEYAGKFDEALAASTYIIGKKLCHLWREHCHMTESSISSFKKYSRKRRVAFHSWHQLFQLKSSVNVYRVNAGASRKGRAIRAWREYAGPKLSDRRKRGRFVASYFGTRASERVFSRWRQLSLKKAQLREKTQRMTRIRTTHIELNVLNNILELKESLAKGTKGKFQIKRILESRSFLAWKALTAEAIQHRDLVLKESSHWEMSRLIHSVRNWLWEKSARQFMSRAFCTMSTRVCSRERHRILILWQEFLTQQRNLREKQLKMQLQRVGKSSSRAASHRTTRLLLRCMVALWKQHFSFRRSLLDKFSRLCRQVPSARRPLQSMRCASDIRLAWQKSVVARYRRTSSLAFTAWKFYIRELNNEEKRSDVLYERRKWNVIGSSLSLWLSEMRKAKVLKSAKGQFLQVQAGLQKSFAFCDWYRIARDHPIMTESERRLIRMQLMKGSREPFFGWLGLYRQFSKSQEHVTDLPGCSNSFLSNLRKNSDFHAVSDSMVEKLNALMRGRSMKMWYQCFNHRRRLEQLKSMPRAIIRNSETKALLALWLKRSKLQTRAKCYFKQWVSGKALESLKSHFHRTRKAKSLRQRRLRRLRVACVSLWRQSRHKRKYRFSQAIQAVDFAKRALGRKALREIEKCSHQSRREKETLNRRKLRDSAEFLKAWRLVLHEQARLRGLIRQKLDSLRGTANEERAFGGARLVSNLLSKDVAGDFYAWRYMTFERPKIAKAKVGFGFLLRCVSSWRAVFLEENDKRKWLQRRHETLTNVRRRKLLVRWRCAKKVAHVRSSSRSQTKSKVNQRQLRDALSVWQRSLRLTNSRRSQSERMKQRQFSIVIQTLRDAISTKTHGRSLSEYLQAASLKGFLRSLFAEWKETVSTAVETRQSGVQLDAYISSRHRQRIFGHLFTAHKHALVRKMAAKYANAVQLQWSGGRLLGLMRQTSVLRARLNRGKLALRVRRLRTVHRAWVGQAKHEKERRQQFEIDCEEHHQGVLVEKGFLALKSLWRFKKLSYRTQEIWRRRGSRIQQPFFIWWKAFLMRRKYISAIHGIANGVKRCSLRRTLRHWLTARKVVLHRLRVLASEPLQEWGELVELRKKYRSMLAEAMDHALSEYMRGVMRDWSHTARALAINRQRFLDLQEAQQVALAMASDRIRALVHRALLGWNERVVEARKQSDFFWDVLSSHGSSILRAWRRESRKAATFDRIVDGAARRLLNGCLRSLRLAVAKRSEQAAREIATADMHFLQFLFRAWTGVVAWRAVRAKRLAQYLELGRQGSERKLMGACLLEWRHLSPHVVDEGELSRRADKHFRARCLSRFFGIWRDYSAFMCNAVLM